MRKFPEDPQDPKPPGGGSASGPDEPDSDPPKALDEVIDTLAGIKFHGERRRDAAYAVLAAFLDRKLELGRRRLREWIAFYRSAVRRRLAGDHTKQVGRAAAEVREASRLARPDPKDPSARAVADEVARGVARALNSLPKEDMEILVRKIRLRQTAAQISDGLRDSSIFLSPESVAQRFRRIKDRLRKELAAIDVLGADEALDAGTADRIVGVFTRWLDALRRKSGGDPIFSTGPSKTPIETD
jgi:hypothetical protein